MLQVYNDDSSKNEAHPKWMGNFYVQVERLTNAQVGINFSPLHIKKRSPSKDGP